MTSTTRFPEHALAVVGMAGRFPDAPDLEAFWRNLAGGHESLLTFSDDELAAAGIARPLLANASYVKKGTVLDGAEDFDAAFFGLSPREAEGLDPQHRVFLECAYHALEHAGYSTDALREAVGVFAGASMNTYAWQLYANREVAAALGGYQLMLGNDKDFLSTRVAYKLNLRGPAVTVQTACSTSLVAVQLACQSLRVGQCDVALAGGVSLNFPQRTGYLFEEEMIHSRDGHCRPFDASASGTRGSAGCGVVVLRRLGDAIRSRDHIHAVVLGAAINNDGARKAGYTAPSIEGQAEVIRAAHADARISADTIGYVEAHGTGTRLGDPIEFAGLTRAFRASTDRRHFCGLGSLKSNIGHLDAAAGVASLIKVILSLERRQIPPTLNFEELNPEIRIDDAPFYIARELRAWDANGPRRAGVSSFGIGGTNAHVVVEEAPTPSASRATRRHHVLTVSARSAEAVRRAAGRLADRLTMPDAPALADAAYTLQVGRRRFSSRLAVVAEDAQDAARALAAAPIRTGAEREAAPQVVFMFPGQGSQYHGMAMGLAEPEFARHLGACAEGLEAHLGFDIRHALRAGAEGATPEVGRDIHGTALAQPALFAVEYALARTLMSWGLQPHAMIGHSLGEYTAACLADVLSLDDALSLIVARGRLMAEAPGDGAMVAVPLAAGDVEALELPVSIAAINGPALTVVSGTRTDIERLEMVLGARGLQARRLHTSHAFHSALMDPVLDPFRACVSRVSLRTPKLPFVSNLTGTWIRDSECTDPDYWVRHLRHTVRFAQGVETAARLGSPLFIEVGPGDVLTSLARPLVGSSARDIVGTMPRRLPADAGAARMGDRLEERTLLEGIGRAWMAGADIEWGAFHADEALHRVPLPGYPFESKRFTVAAPPPPSPVEGLRPSVDVADWFAVPSWATSAQPAPAPRGRASGAWLVLAGESTFDRAVLAAVPSSPDTTWVVEPGREFERLGDRRFRIAPGEPSHYERVLEAVFEAGVPLDATLHLWNVTDPSQESSIDRAFFSPLLTARAIANRVSAPTSLLVVSNGLHAVRPGDVVHPIKAALIGPVRVTPQELPHVWTASLDVPRDMSDDDAAAVARQVVAEVSGLQPARVVAFRDGERWEQTFRPVRLEAADGVPLRQGGRYLITGAFGGIGSVLARYLVETFGARLVLTTRTPLPPRSEWAAWLAAHDDTDATAGRIRTILDLEGKGASVDIISGEAVEPGHLLAAIRASEVEGGPINGIVHAAGLPGGGVLQRLAREDAEAVLASKVDTTQALEPLLDAEGFDFVLLCSSINAVAGGPASADYTAANAFLDAFATAHRHRRTRVVAVNWGPWRDAGMALRAAQRHGVASAREVLDTHGIGSAEGIETFLRALASGLPQVVVTTTPPAMVLVAQAEAERIAHRNSRVAQVTRTDHSERQATEDSEAAATGGLTHAQATLREIWMQLLGVPTITLDDDFFTLGGHSLLATGMLARVRERLGAHLTLAAFFDAPTIRLFSALIEAQQPQAVTQGVDASVGASREEFEF